MMHRPWLDRSIPIEQRIDLLLSAMTLDEKVGQLGQIQSDKAEPLLPTGGCGSVILASSAFAGNDPQPGAKAAEVNRLQRIAVEQSRLGIPQVFGRDVIHGHRTVFPIPLGQAATWDPALVEAGAAIAAREAAADGVRWTFSPMLDISRDPRWGRQAEGAGEDPVLTAAMGAAAVRGYQGDDPSHPDRIAACAKHYVGYGAAEGGRDYNTAELSQHILHDIYLPPFRAAVAAGALTVMSSFNEIGGQPVTSSRRLLTEVLRGSFGFTGFVVTDWNAVAELECHGVSGDGAASTAAALHAGADMDMVSGRYREHLAVLVASGRVPMSEVDEAVRRILRVKFALGLFERPYADEAAAAQVHLRADHRAAARETARRSLVLLQNRDGVLPLPAAGRIAVVGPLAHVTGALHGTWTLDGKAADVVSVVDAITALAPKGLRVSTSGDNDHDHQLHMVHQADVAVLVMGEHPARSGEANSTTSVELPPGQREFIRACCRLGTPIVLVVCAGRAIALEDEAAGCAAVIHAWHPGTEGGTAIAEVLLGLHEPGGRLPVSLPRRTGQVPIYYNCKPTGRPLDEYYAAKPRFYRYLDGHGAALFPFGHGLGYTTWAVSAPRVLTAAPAHDRPLRVAARIANTGQRAGATVVQVYLRNHVARVSRPLRQLAAWQRVELPAGAGRDIEIEIPAERFVYADADGRTVSEPGRWTVWIGLSAIDGEPLPVVLA
jgi:beta-glucosidase